PVRQMDRTPHNVPRAVASHLPASRMIVSLWGLWPVAPNAVPLLPSVGIRDVSQPRNGCRTLKPNAKAGRGVHNLFVSCEASTASGRPKCNLCGFLGVTSLWL